MKTVNKKVMKKEVDLEKAMLEYLQNSSKHMFQTKFVWEKDYKDNYMKIFPAKIDGKLYCVKIKFTDKDVSVEVIDTSWMKEKKDLGNIKNEIFRQNVNHKSVKTSVEMKIKMDIVKRFISESTDIESLKLEIKKILK